jgi:hypothetical protein
LFNKLRVAVPHRFTCFDKPKIDRMKKTLFACVLIASLMSCNNTSNDNKTPEGTKTHSAATDSTQTPNGVTTGSVISTNPDATKTDSAQQR